MHSVYLYLVYIIKVGISRNEKNTGAVSQEGWILSGTVSYQKLGQLFFEIKLTGALE